MSGQERREWNSPAVQRALDRPSKPKVVSASRSSRGCPNKKVVEQLLA